MPPSLDHRRSERTFTVSQCSREKHMSTTRTVSALALALAIGACTDAPTTAPSSSSTTLAPPPATMAKQSTAAPSTTLSNVPLYDAAGNVIGSFTGTATLSSLAASGGGLVGNLLLNGTAVLNGVTTAVTGVIGTAAVTASGDCPILNLDVGQIHLNLLGLDVSLSAISLDIVAQPGPGQLLGNLLCAVVHLLDGPTSGGLSTALTNLLNTINGLLAGL
jgi:hypothetical protein